MIPLGDKETVRIDTDVENVENGLTQSRGFHERLGLFVQEKPSLLEVIVCCSEFSSYLRLHLP